MVDKSLDGVHTRRYVDGKGDMLEAVTMTYLFAKCKYLSAKHFACWYIINHGKILQYEEWVVWMEERDYDLCYNRIW